VTKRINLALQGGGSHGAFTWGALDAILADERLEIVGVSGASAGAMNAVVLASGLIESREAARRKLEDFWRGVALEVAPGATNPAVDLWLSMWKAMFAWPLLTGAATEAASPYVFNPLNLNPLRDALTRMIDFDALRRTDPLKLFIAATNVRTGKGAVFPRDVLTAEHIIASATLPHLFQAAIIDGEAYWDGGYSGNPPLWPLFYETDCCDTIIVQIDPIARDAIPKSPEEISNRVNEISFNSSLLAELRAADFVARLIREGVLNDPRYKLERLHRIGGAGRLDAFSADTKLDVSWAFLQELRDLGRTAAQDWIAAHYDDIGERSTLDVPATLARTPAG
jgi:NTE family protein